jgi:hypothetical protein
LTAFLLSPDGRTLFVCRSGSEGINLYETATWGLRGTLPFAVTRARLCPRGRIIWLGQLNNGVVHVDAWREPARPGRRSEEELRKVWDALGSEDAAAGFAAVRELLAAPPEQAVALLARIEPVGPVGSERVARLIADLDDDDFDVRQRASATLRKFGPAAELPLHAALAAGPSLEARGRLVPLLKALERPDPRRRRFLRGVEVLEALATPRAAVALERLADGAEGAPETRDASAALARVRSRTKK